MSIEAETPEAAGVIARLKDEVRGGKPRALRGATSWPPEAEDRPTLSYYVGARPEPIDYYRPTEPRRGARRR